MFFRESSIAPKTGLPITQSKLGIEKEVMMQLGNFKTHGLLNFLE
jgi:hypothetical protein